ncbi:MAG: type I phosphomannose isomerase catalytic subunit [Oscillospiraceae bacterium]
MYPIKLKAPCKDYIWGGNRLRTDFFKVSDKDKIAETWELSCHPDGESIISNGDFEGKTLSEYIKINGDVILGTNFKGGDFPILIKFIDAKDNLSVQVHPNDDYAKRIENSFGKTEMWYVIDCEEGATLVCGFKGNPSGEEIKKRVQDGTIMDILNSVPVKKGDVFFIEAGTVHAIGKNILIAEIQQNSNTTYRLYDFGRGREVHIEKSLDVIDTNLGKATPQHLPVTYDGYSIRKLIECDYFKTYLYNVDTQVSQSTDGTTFHSLTFLDGNGSIQYGDNNISVRKGDSIFIPANFGKYTVLGDVEYILSTI